MSSQRIGTSCKSLTASAFVLSLLLFPVGASGQTPAPASPATSLPPTFGTFGFTAGETREQIITAVGRNAVIKTDGDIMELSSAPTPNPAFDSYLVIVSAKQGLVKLIATGVDIDEDADGKKMKAIFAQVRDLLKATYGEPSDNFDFLKAGSTLKKPGEFMLALTNQDRALSTYWTKRDFGNQITTVALEGNGLGNSKGYLSLEFEFTGYHDYLLSK